MTTATTYPLPEPPLRRMFRVQAGLTLQQAADLFEVSPSAVYRWEAAGDEAANPVGRNRRVYAAWCADQRALLIEKLRTEWAVPARRAA